MIDFSIIVPTYNRQNEIEEFISFADKLNYPKDKFELIVVDDGSQDSTPDFLQKAKEIYPLLNLKTLCQKNAGPSAARNNGATVADGEYLLFADSDCLLPPNWLSEIKQELDTEEVDYFGGADKEHPEFTAMQKAISFSMTAFLTTGGIRGGKKKNFQPRSFNMGIKKSAFLQVGGFSNLRFGEDIDLSLRLKKIGKQSRLFPNAWVYHKRRATIKQFWKQVLNSGSARINLGTLHPGTTKLVHLAPAIFTLGFVGILAESLFCPYILALPLFYILLLWLSATIRYKNPFLAVLCVITSFVQLLGYGCGFLLAWTKKVFTGKSRHDMNLKNFYK